MKKYIILIAVGMMVISILPGCKKGNNPSPSSTSKTYFDFLKNTQWVGTLDRSGYEYPAPCCLRINADTTIAVYAPFFFLVNNVIETADSIKGKINSIDSLPDGRTRIKIKFNYISDVEIYFTNRKNLICISTDANKPIPFQAEIFPNEVLLKGTTWSGPIMTEQSATGYAYPDLSDVSFLADKTATSYHRNGKLITDTGLTPVELSYSQKGAMVFLFGFDETNSKEPAYFGMLLPSGDKMMIYSGSQDARLPYYTQTIAWYGPLGVTPVINKQ
jgi:hypothetical protein